MCELALNQHLRNRTAFTSDLCNRRFMLNSGCNGHIHTYAGGQGNILLLVMCVRRLSHFKLPSSSICAIILGNGPFYVICVRNNLHESELKRHLRIHTGEHPFSRDLCKKSFVLNGNWKKHYVIVLGSIPFCVVHARHHLMNEDNLRCIYTLF